MLSKYMKVFEAIILLEEQAGIARKELVRGDSPYVTLTVAKMHAKDAMKEWQKSAHGEG